MQSFCFFTNQYIIHLLILHFFQHDPIHSIYFFFCCVNNVRHAAVNLDGNVGSS
jgi:hypothetical protein